MISGGNKVSLLSLSGCANTFQNPSGVRSRESHLFSNTRFQAPLESSECVAGASNFGGDLELAVMDTAYIHGIPRSSWRNVNEVANLPSQPVSALF